MRMVRSTFYPNHLESTRIVQQIMLPAYEEYKQNGGNIDGDTIEVSQFEYNADNYITKEEYTCIYRRLISC